MWSLWLPRLEKTAEELKCESTSQIYVWGASSLCSKALDELIWENVKWQSVTASQFRFTHAYVGDLQVWTNSFVSKRVLEFMLAIKAHDPFISAEDIYMYFNMYITSLQDAAGGPSNFVCTFAIVCWSTAYVKALLSKKREVQRLLSCQYMFLRKHVSVMATKKAF